MKSPICDLSWFRMFTKNNNKKSFPEKKAKHEPSGCLQNVHLMKKKKNSIFT